MHGESPYLLMFGPDICGPGTKKVHVIFSYKGKNHLINKEIRCKDDVYTHFYTLIVQPDNTYEVLIDNEKVESGNLEDDWDFLAPKKIKDPSATKPDNWDERVSNELDYFLKNLIFGCTMTDDRSVLFILANHCRSR